MIERPPHAAPEEPHVLERGIEAEKGDRALAGGSHQPGPSSSWQVAGGPARGHSIRAPREGPQALESRARDPADAAAALGATWQPPVPGTEEAVVGGEVRSAQNGHAIEGATVTVAGTGQSRVTRANGRYFILDVAGGTHTVTCQAPGYQTASQGVSVPDETLQLDWALVPQ